MSTIMHGYINKTGTFIVPRSLSIADRFSGGLARAEPAGSATFGFINPRGEWVLEPTAEWYGGVNNGVHTFNMGGKRNERGAVVGGAWGMTAEGKVLEPRFDGIKSFAEDRIPVQIGKRWGYANASAEVVIDPQYEWAGSFSGGAAVVAIDDKDAYIGPDGSVLVAPQDHELWTAFEGCGRLKRGPEWFLIDLQGNELSPAYDEIWAMKGGMVQVKKGEQFGFVGPDGVLIGGRLFDEAYGWGSGMAPVRIADEWFVLMSDGQLLGPYNSCGAELNGFVAIGAEPGVGFLRSDRFLIEPQYASARGFSDGLAGVQNCEGLWTFVDRDGKPIHEPRWNDIGAYDEGIVPTRLGPRWGVCDATGKVLTEHRFTRISDFSEGLASAQRLRWDREIDAPPPQVCAMPEGGLTHPVFADATEADDLRLTVLFEPTLNDPQLRELRQFAWAVKSAMDARAIGGKSLKDDRFWFCNYALSMCFTNLPRPVLAADLIMDELHALRLPIKELAFFLFRDDPEVPPSWQLMYPFKPAAKHPDDPLGPNAFRDFETYWNAVWGDSVIPRSENLFYLQVARFDRDMNVMLAERMLSLHVPGMRVCSGTMQHAPGYIDRPGERTDQVVASLTQQLAERFSANRIWVPPFVQDYHPPFPARGDWTPGVQTVEYEGRKGYSFAIDPPSIIQDVGPDVFRYREQELMDAIAATITELDLEPVILWQLFGNPLHPNLPHYAGNPMITAPDYYICQVWEK